MRNTFRKKFTSLLMAMCMVFGGVGLLNFGPISISKTKQTHATSQEVVVGAKYYEQLSSLAKKFYNAIDSMKTAGTLKANGSYDLIANAVILSSDVKFYADGNTELLKDFAAAKDAYSLDHPEVFYVDFDLLDLSLGKKGNVYTATIDAGRNESYIAKGFNLSTLQTEIDFYESAVGLKSLLPIQQNLTTIQKVEYVNQAIINKAEYAFIDSVASSHVHSAYGIVKYGIAVADGYAKTFKACMDALNVECVEVVGYVANELGIAYESHSWNYVKLEDGGWYAVDVTLNDKYNIADNEYLFVGSKKLNTRHIEQVLISNSGPEFVAPKIQEKSLKDEALKVETSYEENVMKLTVSYNGKSATKVKEEENLYVIIYRSTISNGVIHYGLPEVLYIKDVEGVTDSTSVEIEAYYPIVKIAVTNIAPDTEIVGEKILYGNLQDSSLICSNVVMNELYGEKEEPVRPVSTIVATNGLTEIASTDAEDMKLASEDVWNITLTYNANFKKVVDEMSVNVRVSSVDDGTLETFVLVEDVVWSEETPNVIKFKFTPSALQQHNKLTYLFAPVNLTVADNENYIEPKYASIIFEKENTNLSRIYQDSRLYLKQQQAATLIDNESVNLASGSWVTESGLSYLKDQITQVTLVASKSSGEQYIKMVAGVKAASQIAEENFYGSAAYELQLNVAGNVQTIPKGNYIKVAFGYPQGYSYESLKNGVTFKVYHFAKNAQGELDYNNPQPIDCVATEYGIVVAVDSFSPFMIVAANKTAFAESKTIYSRTINAGGEIENISEVHASKMVCSATGDESVIYAIKAKTGYKIDFVLLNGEDVTENVKNGELSINVSNLKENNTLDVAFVSETIAQKESAANIENLNSEFAANQQPDYIKVFDKEKGDDKTLMIVLIVSISVVVTAAIVIASIVLVRKKALKK